jgi:2-hydroxychromene-2-carboxylate isomerase
MPKLEFWYDFASTYSYLSAIRIEAMAKPAQVEIIYRPFLLGPIFKSYGWNTSPFRLFPVKGNHMVRDITRIAGDRGSAFHMPEVFPANSLQAARMALVAEEQGCIGSFTRLVFEAEFSECRDGTLRHRWKARPRCSSRLRSRDQGPPASADGARCCPRHLWRAHVHHRVG